YSLDELGREEPVVRQLTSTAGSKSSPRFSPDGKQVYYLDGGRIHVVPLEGGQPRAIPVTAELTVDFDQEKHAVFDQAWTYLNDHFYDPDFHGVDWRAVREAYAPVVAGARTPSELRRALSLMVGALNASHVAVRGRASGAT